MTAKLLDVRERPIGIGDNVVFGDDNGSTLRIGVVFKVSEKLVFITANHNQREYRRYPCRVAVLT